MNRMNGMTIEELYLESFMYRQQLKGIKEFVRKIWLREISASNKLEFESMWQEVLYKQHPAMMWTEISATKKRTWPKKNKQIVAAWMYEGELDFLDWFLTTEDDWVWWNLNSSNLSDFSVQNPPTHWRPFIPGIDTVENYE